MCIYGTRRAYASFSSITAYGTSGDRLDAAHRQLLSHLFHNPRLPSTVLSAENVHFYDASNPTVVLGGLRQNGSVTREDFIEMLAILFITETPIGYSRSA